MNITKKIWIYWHQGFEHAPNLVRECLKSWKRLNKSWEIITLDCENLQNYIVLNDYVDPDHFLVKKIVDGKKIEWDSSGLIRLLLLRKYGGVWADATIFCNKPLDDWLNEFSDYDFFIFSSPSHGLGRPISNWFIYGEKNSYIINKWLESELEYCRKCQQVGCPWIMDTFNEWETKRYGNHYFWPMYIFNDLLKNDSKFKEIWDSKKKLSAKEPHYIQNLGMLSKKTENFEKEIKDIPLFKLTYRYDESQNNGQTILSYLFRQNNIKI